MNLLFPHSTPSHPLLKISCFPKPKTPNHFIRAIPISSAIIPARDRVIDFGKHKGRMLGTLPSTYLQWVSKNLRARDYEDWANLADEVLTDPVYRDRIEWEFAERVLHGDVSSSSPRSDSAVSELLEISLRFGWDNDDKVGWKKIDYALLGTSKGARIPRVRASNRSDEENLKGEKVRDKNGGEEARRRRRIPRVRVSSREVKLKREEVRDCDGGGESGEEARRRERRERLTLKMRSGSEISSTTRSEKMKLLGIEGKEERIGNDDESKNHQMEIDTDQTVEIKSSPFPGRESLLKNVLNRRRL